MNIKIRWSGEDIDILGECTDGNYVIYTIIWCHAEKRIDITDLLVGNGDIMEELSKLCMRKIRTDKENAERDWGALNEERRQEKATEKEKEDE